MKIGFDAKRAFNNTTGLGNYSRFILNALLKFAPGNDYFAYTPKIKKNIFDNFPTSQIRNSKSKIQNQLWRSWLIIKDLKKDKIGIYHGLSNELPLRLQPKGIKSVVTIHDLIFLRYPELYPMIDRFFYQFKFRYACQTADAIVAISQQTKRDIIDFYQIPSKKIRVIYQDCDEKFKEKLSPAAIHSVLQKYNLPRPYLLCVGTITERKNQLNLVKAFQQLKKIAIDSKNLELVLVGGKSVYQQSIEEYIRQESLENVQILNQVPLADLPALYQAAEIFIYPSFFEGFGLPIIEALNSGVPVIAATGSCLEEAGGNGGIYFNPLNVSELVGKISQVLTNKKLREQLILAGKEHVKQFNPENAAKDLIKLYQEI